MTLVAGEQGPETEMAKGGSATRGLTARARIPRVCVCMCVCLCVGGEVGGMCVCVCKTKRKSEFARMSLVAGEQGPETEMAKGGSVPRALFAVP